MLEQRAGSLPDANAIADAAAATWRLVEAQLVPVIGARGLEVLFRRAVHQTSTGFPWLTAVAECGAGVDPLPGLVACLVGQPGADAAEASYTLLLIFAELLMTLIGESLTDRLLADVWALPSLPAELETAS